MIEVECLFYRCKRKENVSEKIIDMLVDVDILHHHWNKKDAKNAFHHYFSNIRKREDRDIFTTAIIPLPFPLQKTIINTHKLGNDHVTKVTKE